MTVGSLAPFLLRKESEGVKFETDIFLLKYLLMEKIQRSPVEVGSFSHYLRRVSYMSGGERRISEPSTLWSCRNLGNVQFETEVIFASQKGRAGECIWNLGFVTFRVSANPVQKKKQRGWCNPFGIWTKLRGVL